MGGVAYSTANGGTIVVGTGDNAVGGVVTPSGLGVYTSRNDGNTWTKATGVPDGLTTYKVVVDPNNANVNYVATSKGLFRSTDDGISYTNVVLPTGCTDVTAVQCDFANTVSDVDVQAGTGSVIAAVGWAYGQRKSKAGFVMAPQNGIYTSPNGTPGSFTFQDPGAITFPGTTASDSTDLTRPWNGYVVISTNALDANPLFQSNIVNPANDPIHRGDCPSRCGRMYDFLDAVISPTDGSVSASFVDTCTHTDWNGVVTNCNTVRAAGFNAGTGSHGVSGDMRGLAAKELSGPTLLTVPRCARKRC